MMSWVSGVGICIYYSVNVEQTISYAIVIRRRERKLKSLLGRVRDDIIRQFRKTLNCGDGRGGERALSSNDCGGSTSRKRMRWRKKDHGGEMMRFNYDPFSYSLNFDDGNFGFFC